MLLKKSVCKYTDTGYAINIQNADPTELIYWFPDRVVSTPPSHSSSNFQKSPNLIFAKHSITEAGLPIVVGRKLPYFNNEGIIIIIIIIIILLKRYSP